MLFSFIYTAWQLCYYRIAYVIRVTGQSASTVEVSSKINLVKQIISDEHDDQQISLEIPEDAENNHTNLKKKESEDVTYLDCMKEEKGLC